MGMNLVSGVWRRGGMALSAQRECDGNCNLDLRKMACGRYRKMTLDSVAVMVC